MMRKTLTVAALGLLILGCKDEGTRTTGTASQPAGVPVVKAEQPSVDHLLDRMANTLQTARSLSIHIKSAMQMPGMKDQQLMDSTGTLTLERPRRLALRFTSKMMGLTLVADGKQISTSIPTLKKYTQTEQEEDIAAMADSGTLGTLSMMGGGMMFISSLLEKDVKADILEGVTESRVVGRESIDGQDAWHMHFQQDQMDWDLWLADSEQPLPLKIEVDFGKSMPSMGDDEEEDEEDVKATPKKPRDRKPAPKMIATLRLSQWKVDAQIPADAFTFKPPADATKVDTLFEMPEQEPSPLLGEVAPPVKLALLGGGKMDLASHRDRHVVVLDFWATWCGPCVQALPILHQVTRDFRDKGVVFYAVNQEEDEEIISKFLKSKKLDVTVALDSKGAIGESYQLQGIPCTVIVGKDGRVQAVHEGFSPDLKKKLTSELTEVVAGKKLATTRPVTSAPAATGELSLRWKLDGAFDSVAVDGRSGQIMALEKQAVVTIDAKGTRQGKPVPIKEGNILRLANLAGDERPELITFRSWGSKVVAHSPTGEMLWSYPTGSGVDDVGAANVLGDDFDEVMIGLNGGGGLHLLTHTGQKVWSNTTVKNVWHVTAGPMGREKEPVVISTSAMGQVHLYSVPDGKKIDDVTTSLYANMVRLMPSSAHGPLIAAGGTGGRHEQVQFFDRAGTSVGKISLADKGHISSAWAANTKPWLAVGLMGGKVSVIDADSLALIGEVESKAMNPEVAWLETSSQAVLLVAAQRSLLAYDVKASASSRPATASAPAQR